MAGGDEDVLRPDWLSKTLAGVLLGLVLAFGVSGLLSLALSPMATSPRNQLVMWSVVPVWMGVLGGCFFFRTGPRAWLWLGGATVLTWGAFLLLRNP
ncbi:hypothetical protein MFUL124B02_11180 [Myxococcus fulvus 124B02]|nr:hypothetical protein MFUL124B02_11180 [Myxococcus fulvus 124B02]